MRRLAGALIAVACLAATACGGHTVTKKDVIARANGICINALRAVRSTPPPAGAAGSPTALAGYLRKVLPIIEKQASDTRALPRPSEDRNLLDRYIAAVTASTNEYRSLAADAGKGDRAAVSRDLAALRGSPAPTLAARYGLTRCNASAGTGAS
ncbi:MAG TPA: hypothetical protein VHV28_09765 [Solirubrobacteraceae bacterium]|jgi:hypothetical protein|nr:hypothetical protein [Solirubrobacteraceae bacterium]